MPTLISPGRVGRVGHAQAPSGPAQWLASRGWSGSVAGADFERQKFWLPALGPELVTNGTFDSDPFAVGGGWDTSASTAPGIWVWSSNQVVSQNNDATHKARLRQTIATTAGRLYRFSFTGTTSLYLGTTAGGTEILSGLAGTFYFIASGSSTYISNAAVNAGETVDNVSVKEVLDVPRWATEDEWFVSGRYEASSTTARTYLDSAGVLRNGLAANAPRYTYEGGRRWLALENQLVNIVTCAKYNPTTTTNLSISSGTGTLSVVSDGDAIAASGLSSVCTNGNVYKVDNSGSGTSTVIISGGTTANTNLHSVSCYIRGGVGRLRINTGTSGTEFISSTGYAHIKAENITPSSSGRPFVLEIYAGQVVYFILPGLYEQSFAPLYPVVGTATAAVTRAIETFRFPAIVEAVLQRSEAMVLRRHKLLAVGSGTTYRRDVGIDTTGHYGASKSNTVARMANASDANAIDATAGSGGYQTGAAVVSAHSAAGRAICVNGGVVATDATAIGTRAEVHLGRDKTNAANTFGDGLYNLIAIFPTRDDARMPTLTATGW